jgi:hypothetical protein
MVQILLEWTPQNPVTAKMVDGPLPYIRFTRIVQSGAAHGHFGGSLKAIEHAARHDNPYKE